MQQEAGRDRLQARGRDGGGLRLVGRVVDEAGADVPVQARDPGRRGRPACRGEQRGPARGGAGLGLPLARGLTEAMNGQLTIESRPGAGTTSAVTLPAC